MGRWNINNIVVKSRNGARLQEFSSCLYCSKAKSLGQGLSFLVCKSSWKNTYLSRASGSHLVSSVQWCLMHCGNLMSRSHIFLHTDPGSCCCGRERSQVPWLRVYALPLLNLWLEQVGFCPALDSESPQLGGQASGLPGSPVPSPSVGITFCLSSGSTFRTIQKWQTHRHPKLFLSPSPEWGRRGGGWTGGSEKVPGH